MSNVKAVSAVLDSLGDPTRRAIFDRVSREPRSVGELAQGLPVSRPAVSQHLKRLKEAGLVREQVAGTRRIYHVDPRGIAVLREWLDGLWGSALDAFKDFADQQAEKDKAE